MNTRALSTVALLAFSCTDEPGGMAPASSDTTSPTSGSTSPESTTVPATGADTTAPATGADTTASGAETTAGASGPSTGLPTGSTGLTTGDSSGGPAMLGVYARYEVRDNTGTPVEIWATPTCSFGGDCFAGDFESMAADCMAVQAVGQQAFSMQFELATGDPEPCYQDHATWQGISLFFDAACTQPALAPGYGTTYAVMVSGTLYYAPRAAAVAPASTFVWVEGLGCLESANTAGNLYAPPSPVPPAILGILGAAPYEIAIAY